jgi:beta-lactamase superfamily II metal-dependent hydrolase
MTVSRACSKPSVFVAAILVLFSSLAIADVVTPLDDVVTSVVVRQTPSALGSKVANLRPSEQAELLGFVPNWYRVRLANGISGFVPSRWTRVIASTPPPAPVGPFTIDVVDVGTGLGVLVRGPDFTLIYDGGSNDDLARGPANRMLAYIRAVAPTLTKIDELVLSHPHRDHVELLPDLFAAYQVNEVWDSGRVNDICGYRAFLGSIRDEPGVRYHNALQDFGTQGFSFAAETCYDRALPAEVIQLTLSSRITPAPIPLGQNASMTILHADGSPFPSPNDNTLVVRLDLGNTRVLLMGDAEAGGRAAPSVVPTPTSIEGKLLACCAADLAARVMVVGHHGSKTSSRRAFLDAVSASIFIVSSGPTKYGTVTLPDQEVITELTSRGQVFRTDQDDAACAHNPAKIGPDNDGQPGGCDNIRLVISDSSPIQVSDWHGHD